MYSKIRVNGGNAPSKKVCPFSTKQFDLAEESWIKIIQKEHFPEKISSANARKASTSKLVHSVT